MIKIYKNFIRQLTLGIIILMSIQSCDEDDNKYPMLGEDPRSITEIAANTPELSTLAGSLSRVGLDATLNTTTTYTVIAPNNEAFTGVDLNSLSDEQLEQILLNHVISTTTSGFSASLESGYVLSMSAGPDDTNLSLYIGNSDKLTFNGVATVVAGKFDIGATNGVVHIVDGVLHPPTVADHIHANPDFSSLAQAIELAGLEDELDGESINTVFAPTNAAFDAFIADLTAVFGWTTLEEIPVDVLTNVLLYHITAENNTSEDIDGTTFESALEVDDAAQTFTVSGTQIEDASYTNANLGADIDIQGINGIVHSIDKVLLPEDVFQSLLGATLDLVSRAEDRGYTMFLEALDKTGLTESLVTNEYTVFMPSNDAFTFFFTGIENYSSLEDFVSEDDISLLRSLIQYQLYEGTLLAGEISSGSSLTTVFGENISIDSNGRLVPSFSGAPKANIEISNIGATNGVIHQINRVLIPDGIAADLGVIVSGLVPVADDAFVYFDFNGTGYDSWWGDINDPIINDAATSADGTPYFDTKETQGGDWTGLFFRNAGNNFTPAAIGTNIDDYDFKFDINVKTPGTGSIRFRFEGTIGDVFYEWDLSQQEESGWTTIVVPANLLGVSDFSLVDNEFGAAYSGSSVLDFSIDNIRFEAK